MQKQAFLHYKKANAILTISVALTFCYLNMFLSIQPKFCQNNISLKLIIKNNNIKNGESWEMMITKNDINISITNRFMCR